MVVALVVITVVTFLVVEWLWFRRRRVEVTGVAEQGAVEFSRGAPTRLYWHPGHAWVRLARDGTAWVGADAFAWDFLGEPATVELPALGRNLRQGVPAWTLVSSRGRRLGQVMPVEGEVVEVNRDVARPPLDPTAHDSWLLRVRPSHLRASLSNLLRGDAAQYWRDAVKSHVTTRIAPSVGPVATDGGELITAFGDRLDDAVWDALHDELFPAATQIAAAEDNTH